MSYQEKKTLASIASGILVLAAYCLYAFNPTRMASIPPGDIRQWAVTMLVFIAIGAGVTIIIQIVFHILFSISVAVQEKIRNNESDDKTIEKNIELEMVEDEMDKLIELKSTRMGFIVAGIGFVAGLISLVLNYSPIVMLNILYISFSIGSLSEGFAQVFYYRRGVANV